MVENFELTWNFGFLVIGQYVVAYFKKNNLILAAFKTFFELCVRKCIC